jgi:hypothetical protein
LEVGVRLGDKINAVENFDYVYVYDDRHRAITISGKGGSRKEIRRGISNNRSSRMKS